MRQIGEAFAARLAADGTTLCACWRFTRRDGAVFGATDHDRVLAFDGVTYEPSSGLTAARRILHGVPALHAMRAGSPAWSRATGSMGR